MIVASNATPIGTGFVVSIQKPRNCWPASCSCPKLKRKWKNKD